MATTISLDQAQALLWPPAPYTPWLPAGAQARIWAEYGQGLDRGALRQGPGTGGAEILWVGAQWIPFDPTNFRHLTAARAYSRVKTWSQSGNSSNTHAMARGWFLEIEGREPDEMENVDLQFCRELHNYYAAMVQGVAAVRPAWWNPALGGTGTRPSPPARVPVPPARDPVIVVTPPTPPASSAPSRYYLVRVDSPLGSLAIVREVDAATVRGLG